MTVKVVNQLVSVKEKTANYIRWTPVILTQTKIMMMQ